MLPNDLAACHAIMRDQAAQIVKLEMERDAALQLAFRKKVERYLADPKQFVLGLKKVPATKSGQSVITPPRSTR
ncbi:MAG: hypothetical protein ACKO5R_14800 [Planctomycetaceae bacterium]